MIWNSVLFYFSLAMFSSWVSRTHFSSFASLFFRVEKCFGHINTEDGAAARPPKFMANSSALCSTYTCALCAMCIRCGCTHRIYAASRQFHPKKTMQEHISMLHTSHTEHSHHLFSKLPDALSKFTLSCTEYTIAVSAAHTR